MRKQIFIIEACHMPGTVVGCQLLCLGSCLARRVVLQLFVQTYHRLLQHFDTSITNAYLTHFVKSSGLNAKAKFHYSLNPLRHAYIVITRSVTCCHLPSPITFPLSAPCDLYSDHTICRVITRSVE
jgi:hypothetical protein